MGYSGGVSKHELEVRLKRIQAELRRLLAEKQQATERRIAVQVTSTALDQSSLQLTEHQASDDPHPQYGTYVHNQSTAAAVWTIRHDLNRFPSVTIVDSANSAVIGEVRYVDQNEVEVAFRSAFSGKAYLN